MIITELVSLHKLAVSEIAKQPPDKHALNSLNSYNTVYIQMYLSLPNRIFQQNL